MAIFVIISHFSCIGKHFIRFLLRLSQNMTSYAYFIEKIGVILYNKAKEKVMKIKIEKVIHPKFSENEFTIKIEAFEESQILTELVQYIEEFSKTKAIVTHENEFKNIVIDDILYFYSDKKYNYCKTIKEEFKIKSKLYELEKMNSNFLRISKSCVINIAQVACFDLGETGKIIVKFLDGSVQPVSRRKIRDVLDYLEERRI